MQRKAEGNQRKSKETKGNPRKPTGIQRKSKETKGNPRKIKVIPRRSKEIKGNPKGTQRESKGNGICMQSDWSWDLHAI